MNNGKSLPLIILGGSGHARVLADCLQLSGQKVLGFTAPGHHADLAAGIAWIGDDDVLAEYSPNNVELINGIGSTGSTMQRQQLFESMRKNGFSFANLHHPNIIQSALNTRLGEGCQLLAGSLLGPGVQLDDNVLINNRGIIEHDSHIGSHSHVATGAIICGTCQIGEGVHIGAGATVIQGITIGNGTIIASGTVVTKNVEPMVLVAGVPGVVKRSV